MITISEKRSDQLAIAGLLVLAALFVYLIALVFGWGGGYADDYQSVITVSGEGRAFAVPDTATFDYTVRAEADTAAEAQAQIAEANETILAVLAEQGIDENDIKTTNFNVYPRYEYREAAVIGGGTSPSRPGMDIAIEPFYPRGETRVLVGYEATQTNQVRVRFIDSAGDLLGLVSSNGADSVSGLQFIVWDETAVEAEARAEAIADARTKAEELADQLDIRLGDIRDFYEGGDYPIAYDGMAEMRSFDMDVAQSAPTANISLGENEIRKNVSITFEIK